MPRKGNTLQHTVYLKPEATKYLVLLATRSPLVSTEFPSQPAPTTLHSKLWHPSQRPSLTYIVDYLFTLRMRINTNINDQMVHGAVNYGRCAF